MGTSAVAYGNEQRRHVLAVLIGLLKGRAGTVGSDALAPQANRHLVGLGIGPLHMALRVRFVQADVIDYLSLFIVEPAQERAGTEQASETAVGERGESVCK